MMESIKTSLLSRRLSAGCALVLLAAFPASAQIDPAPRKILHLGVDASLHDQGPMGAYAFYYWNQPNVPATNQFLRLAIAPCYVDGELAFKGLLGERTDLAVGAFGGLFANSYQEVDAGNYEKDESFDGDGGGGSVSLYHLFNPSQQIPLTGILRGSVNYEVFEKNDDTGANFVLPANQPFYTLRAGFRFGGMEPYLAPTLGMEISGWYELEQRSESGVYGYTTNAFHPGSGGKISQVGDHHLEATVQRLFARAQLNYTTLESQHYIVFGLQGGAAFNADRLGAFRLGGVLPYTKEFPLPIPGYYYQEISAQDYGMVYGAYTIPFGPGKRWSIINLAAASWVKYLAGTGQPGAMNSGVGTGLGYTSENRRWKIMSLFGYGIQAERGSGRGGYTLGVAYQYNFGSTEYAGQKAYEELQHAHGVTR